MTRVDRSVRLRAVLVALVAGLGVTDLSAQTEGIDDTASNRFAFAVVGSTTGDADRAMASLLRAVDGTASRFVVHFDLTAPSDASCSDAALARRRALLDDSGKPVVPVVAAAEWSSCGKRTSDPLERLDGLGDALFSGDESLGRARLPWLRQSSLPRFRRVRENVRWQVGPVLFATLNLPDNNNNFRIAAGRNGEFEERLVANRAWLDRTFRLAIERRLAGIVIFVDAAPRFSAPMHTPDSRVRERDGFYEWKLALREFVPAFKGQVLLVQARYAKDPPRPVDVDRPLQDASGRTIAHFARIALGDAGAGGGDDARRWLRIDVDVADPQLFRIATERLFDDPSGELYGPARGP